MKNCSVYGQNDKCWLISTEDATYARQPKTATSNKMVAKVKIIIVYTDARFIAENNLC
jgi:hypothetical protein